MRVRGGGRESVCVVSFAHGLASRPQATPPSKSRQNSNNNGSSDITSATTITIITKRLYFSSKTPTRPSRAQRNRAFSDDEEWFSSDLRGKVYLSVSLSRYAHPLV